MLLKIKEFYVQTRELDMLHFEVQAKKHIRADHPGSVKAPSQYPCFVLVFNSNWNDHGNYTWFALRYFPSSDADSILIGELKLMCTEGEDTYDCLEKSFDGDLDRSKFCSLGIDSAYYRQIHDVLKPLGLDVELLQALCDCANDVTIYDDFRNKPAFQNSLLRDLRSEKALQDARFLLSGTRHADAYSFCYKYVPRFDDSVSAEWRLHLEYNSPDYLRTVGIIGVNGVGKTQMLSQLVGDFLSTPTPNFNHVPLYNCCIVICSTHLDQYNRINRQRQRKPFALCCLDHSNKTKKNLINAIRSISKGRRMLGEDSLMKRYVEMAKRYLGDLAEDIFVVTGEEENEYRVNEDRIGDLIGILSSGQLQIFNLITYICANIRMSSLLVIDEPEIHLHPQFILDFMTTLGEILHQFDSFAVIATHSPLVVREIVDKQVFLMRRMEGNIPQIAPVTFDTFGEDATLLYRNIFGYSEEKSYFTKIVGEMVSEIGYEGTIRELESHMRLSVNARLAIRDIAAGHAERRQEA